MLHEIKNKLEIELRYTDTIVLRSRRDVPYLWCSKNKMNISVCYFKSTNTFKVWTGCGTPENTSVASYLTLQETFDCVNSLIDKELKSSYGRNNEKILRRYNLSSYAKRCL